MFGFFKRNAWSSENVERVYATLAAQARNPSLYTTYGVPDTMDGRLEMLLLHLFVVLNWFKDDKDERVRQAMRDLCDLFFTEMDRAMRESGVGDLAVPKRINKVAQLYAARMTAYDEADRTGTLSRALAEIIFGNAAELERGVALADYVETLWVALSMDKSFRNLQEGLWLPTPQQVAALSREPTP